MRIGRHHQRVAIVRRFGAQLSGDSAIRTGAILDDKCRAACIREMFREETRDGICAAARREAYQEADGLGWIGLSHNSAARQSRYDKEQRTDKSRLEFHTLNR